MKREAYDHAAPRLMLFNIPLVIQPPMAPAIAPIKRTIDASMVHPP
jgi:hypothetical protein